MSVPALIYCGVPSVSSNMSSTIALYPGSFTSAWVYRGRFLAILGMPVKALFRRSGRDYDDGGLEHLGAR